MRAIFELSNTPSVRDSSFHPELIPWEDHVRWFEQARSDPESGFYVVEIDGVVAGQVRFNREGESTIVSISVGSSFRGRGIGDILYRDALTEYRRRCPVTKVEAKIRKGNVQSIAFFNKLGFIYARDEIVNDIESVVLVHSLEV